MGRAEVPRPPTPPARVTRPASGYDHGCGSGHRAAVLTGPYGFDGIVGRVMAGRAPGSQNREHNTCERRTCSRPRRVSGRARKSSGHGLTSSGPSTAGAGADVNTSGLAGRRRRGAGRDAHRGWPPASPVPGRFGGEIKTGTTLVEVTRNAVSDAGSIPAGSRAPSHRSRARSRPSPGSRGDRGRIPRHRGGPHPAAGAVSLLSQRVMEVLKPVSPWPSAGPQRSNPNLRRPAPPPHARAAAIPAATGAATGRSAPARP